MNAILALIQQQRPSWLVWSGVALVFVIGLSLLVYFIIRMRRSDRETEEDWNAAKSTLIDAETVLRPTREDQAWPSPTAAQPVAITDPAVVPPTEPGPVHPTVSRSEIPAPLAVETTSDSAAAEPAGAAPEDHTAASQPQPDSGGYPGAPGTELFASADSAPEANRPAPTEAAVLEDDVWEQLDRAGQVPDSDAVVEQPRAAARFEPPRIEPIVPRRAYEPPTITQIVAKTDPASAVPAGSPTTSQFSSAADRKAEPAVEPAHQHVSARSPRSLGESATVAPKKASRFASGSVLGLPAEPSDKPMTFAAPREGGRNHEDIGSLANYGKPGDDEPRGHWGTITLAAAILLVAGGVLAYLYNPGFQGWVERLRMKARGTTAEAQPADDRPKVKVLPQRSQAENNQVKSWGYVFNNTNDEVLSGLAVELSMIGRDGANETVTVSVNPSELQPGFAGYTNRGVFELT
jgi:hypothetical protein